MIDVVTLSEDLDDEIIPGHSVRDMGAQQLPIKSKSEENDEFQLEVSEKKS